MFAPLIVLGWQFGAPIAAGALLKIASSIRVSLLAADNARMKRDVDLGIDRSPGNTQRKGSLFRFTIREDEVPGHPEFAAEYVLFEGERDNLFDHLRHVEFPGNTSQASKLLRRVAERAEVPYENLYFVWDGDFCDLEKLKRVSANRLKDPEFQASFKND